MREIECSKIFQAIYTEDKGLFESLVESGCANFKSDLGDSVLLECLNKDRLVFFEMLLEAGADPMATDFVGNNSLHKSALRGRLDFVCLLIKYQADLDAEGSDGFTAINYAANFKNWDVVEVLLAAGANPDIPDWYGVTASERIKMKDGPVLLDPVNNSV